jgi:colicin import membrane protein
MPRRAPSAQASHKGGAFGPFLLDSAFRDVPLHDPRDLLYNPRPHFSGIRGQMVNPAEFELQLKVWKDLAISKQMLMRSAAQALKLDPNCSQDELKEALENTLKRIEESEEKLRATREEAKAQIASLEEKLNAALKAKAALEAEKAELLKFKENATAQIANERAAAAKEAQKLKAQVAEKEKQLKAINIALADTPENVLKKMNTFKKQKQEEADARRQVEAAFTSLRKEKQEQDQKLLRLTENSGKLVKKYRELHETATKLHDSLKPHVDAKDLPAVPMMDEDLLEAIENPDAKPDEKKDKKKAKK